MEAYGQEPELRLLATLQACLDGRAMIDVGAERGVFVAAMLDAGADHVYAFDPHPDNAAGLHARFAEVPGVTVGEFAISDADGSAELHVATDPGGATVSFGHTLLERRETDEINWRSALAVRRRSLQSLITTGDIPSRVGILKIDTEGHDLAVVEGMGSLEADVVMVEHWTDLPHGLGPCPWTADEMIAALRAGGFAEFGLIRHREEFVTLNWNDAEIGRGEMGNLVFLHDRVLAALLPRVLEFAGWLGEQTVRVGQGYMRAAGERLALVDELAGAAAERLAALDVATAALERERAQAGPAGPAGPAGG